MTKQLHKKEETTHESRKRWSNKPVNVNTPHLGCAPNMADHIWIAASRQMQTYSVHSRRWNPKPWRPNPCTAAAATTHKLPHAAQQCVHMTGVLQVYVLQVCYRCITGVLQVYYRCVTGVLQVYVLQVHYRCMWLFYLMMCRLACHRLLNSVYVLHMHKASDVSQHKCTHGLAFQCKICLFQSTNCPDYKKRHFYVLEKSKTGQGWLVQYLQTKEPGPPPLRWPESGWGLSPL